MVEQGGTTTAEGDVEATQRSPGDAPPLDPGAVERAYRVHRARRHARIERRRESKRAGARFWLVLVLLVAASIGLVVFIAQEIQRLFGI